MTLPAGAAFVLQPFRYESEEDTAIRAKYPNAEEAIFETTLGQESLQGIVTKIFDVVSGFSEAYEVSVVGTYTSDMFDGGVPHWTLADDRYKTDGRVFKTVSTKVDWMNTTTTFVIRG